MHKLLFSLFFSQVPVHSFVAKRKDLGYSIWMKKAPRFPIGTSDFRQLRQEALVYIDKSLFIEQVIDNSARVLLLPRPRRFGKTLNLSNVSSMEK